MALYGNNLVTNPSAESGTTGWTVSGVSSVPGGITGSNCFSFIDDGYMTQVISAAVVGKQPSDFNFRMALKATHADEINPVVARAQITANYSDGTKDTFVIPCRVIVADVGDELGSAWYRVSEYCTVDSEKTLSNLTIRIEATDIDELLVDDIVIAKNVSSTQVAPAYSVPSIDLEALIDLAGTPTSDYGINPTFLMFFPNKCYNSSFEVFDSGTLKPTYWDTDGAVSADAEFSDTYSVMLAAGQYLMQQQVADVGFYDPGWITWATRHRVAFRIKSPLGSSVSVRVLQDVTPLSLYAWSTEGGQEVEITGTTLVIEAGLDWHQSYRTFAFEAAVAGKVKLEITNTGLNPVYIDSVIIEPDVTGHYSSIYTHGPMSTSSGAGGVRSSTITVATHESLHPEDADIVIPEGEYAGSYIRQAFNSLPIKTFYSGTAISNGAGYDEIELDTDASEIDGEYLGHTINIVSGTGAGQSKIIVEYTGSSKIARVHETYSYELEEWVGWSTEPDNTSVISITSPIGKVILLEGVYNINVAVQEYGVANPDPIVVPSRCSLQGQGAGTIIRALSTQAPLETSLSEVLIYLGTYPIDSGPLVEDLWGLPAGSYTSISDILIDGNNTHDYVRQVFALSGIVCEYAANPDIKNITIINLSDYANDSHGATTNASIGMWRVSKASIDNIKLAESHPINLQRLTAGTISNIMHHYAPFETIIGYYLDNCVLDTLMTYTNSYTSSAINLTYCTDTVISNALTTGGFRNFYLLYNTRLLICNTLAQYLQKEGFYLSGDVKSTIVNNAVKNTNGSDNYAMYLGSCTDTLVSNNDLMGGATRDPLINVSGGTICWGAGNRGANGVWAVGIV